MLDGQNYYFEYEDKSIYNSLTDKLEDFTTEFTTFKIFEKNLCLAGSQI